MKIREFRDRDIPQMLEIWNDVVEAGNVFSEDTILNAETASNHFEIQSFTGVIEIDGEIVAIYILHPNNIGHCKHIANASYVVKKSVRGKGVGEKLILHSMKTAKNLGFRILQFNAVTVTNKTALSLYKKLGFTQLGRIPGGYLNSNSEYVDIIPHYIELI